MAGVAGTGTGATAGALLWLARHGETEWSVAGRHTSRTDLPLTAEGEDQALALGRALEGTHFGVVESSPRLRTMRTAELAGLRAEVNHDLAEWDYGDLEGLTLEEITARYPGWTIWDGPWLGGETAGQVAARADRVVERALSLPPGTNALMITHGHMSRVIAARWLRQPPTAGRLFIIGTATISVLGWEHGEPAVQCWNARPAPAPTGLVTAATVAH
jgi:probable phosphoglycerate mutase